MVATASAAVLFFLILSGYASQVQVLKREVDLLDMLRTPLMLSFTRDNAFIPQRDRQNELVSRLLRLPTVRRKVQPQSD